MNDLKLSITILVSYVIVVLGIANIDFFQTSIINFTPLFFFMVAIIVFSELIITGSLIRSGVKISSYTTVLFWVIAYFIVWMLFLKEDRRPVQVEVIQLLLLAISSWLAYDVASRIGQLDQTLDLLSISAYRSRAREINDARDLIDAEMTRSRRYHHPLSLLTFRLDKQKNKAGLKGYTPFENDMRERFAIAKFGQILSDLARNTDLVLRDKEDQFVLICPETDLNNITLLAERISIAVRESLKIGIDWGSAGFPDEALTFDDLLQTARGRFSSHSFED